MLLKDRIFSITYHNCAPILFVIYPDAATHQFLWGKCYLGVLLKVFPSFFPFFSLINICINDAFWNVYPKDIFDKKPNHRENMNKAYELLRKNIPTGVRCACWCDRSSLRLNWTISRTVNIDGSFLYYGFSCANESCLNS